MSDCPECRETAMVAVSLQQLAVSTPAAPVSCRIPWLQAQFTRKQERLSKLELLMLVGVFSSVALGFLGVLLWKWELMRSWMSLLQSGPVSNFPFYLLAGCAALVWVLTEELFSRDA